MRTRSLLVIAAVLVVAAAPVAVAATVITSSSQVRDGALTGRDVKDHSITRADLDRGVGARGPAGPPGPTGPSGVVGYTYVTAISPHDSVSPKEVVAECPSGSAVLGVGYDIIGGKSGAVPDTLTRITADKVALIGQFGPGEPLTAGVVMAIESAETPDMWSVSVVATCVVNGS